MGTGDGQFKFPKDVAISNDGYLFVTDTQGHRIQKFTTPLIKNQLLESDEKINELANDLKSEPINEQIPVPLETQVIPNDFQKPKILVPGDVLIEASGPLLSLIHI